MTDKDVADRQRKLDEMLRRVLAGFVGATPSPRVIADAEATLRRHLDEAIAAGTYVLPDGLLVDRVEVGADLRMKVYFKRCAELP